MDAWPRNFTPTIMERTKLKGGKKRGWKGGLIPEYLTKDYMLKLMGSICVCCQNSLKDYMLEFIERLYAGIDGFNVCVLRELSDSLSAGVVTACVVCVHAKMWVGQ